MPVETEIRSLASFLCVSCGKISVSKDSQVPSLQVEKGVVIKGQATIAKYLVKKSKLSDLLGNDHEERANVEQWLEYTTSQAIHASTDREISQTLKEVNNYLRDKVYINRFHLSAADILLFYALHNVMISLTYSEKQQYIHVSRWFDQLQNMPTLKDNLSNVFFQKILIYGDKLNH